MKECEPMINRKLEITLLTIAWVLTLVTAVIDVFLGFSRESIIRLSCELILLSLWTASVIKRRPNH